MQPFSHSIAQDDRLMRMVGLSVAAHLALIIGLVVAEMLAPRQIDFRDAIQVTLVPPSAPEAQPQPAPDETPSPPIPKPPPTPPLPQTRREPVLAPLEDNPLWDKLNEETPEDSELARQFREMERARPAAPPPSADMEEWWKEMMATAPQPAAPVPAEAAPERSDTPSMQEAFEQIRAQEQLPQAPETITTGELTQWLDAQIGMVLSPGDVPQERVTDVDRYVAVVKKRVDSHFSPPDLFRGRRGQTVVAFVIERDGRVWGIKVEHSSGSEYYDRAAMSAVMTVGKLPPLPEVVKAPSVKMRLLFDMQTGVLR